MVSANVDALSDNFESIITQRDVAGAATIGLAGAAGGVIATQITGQIAPLLGFSSSPSDLSGLLVNGTLKMVVGAALGYLAILVGGPIGLVIGVAGLGGLVLGGGDYINGLLSSSAGVPGSTTATQIYGSNTTSGSVTARQMEPDSSMQSRGHMNDGMMEMEQVSQRGGVEFR